MAHFLWSLRDKLVDAGGDFIGSIIAATVILLLGFIGSYLIRAISYFYRMQKALGAVGRVQKDGVWVEGAGVWACQPIFKPKDYMRRLETSKVLTIANLKGGVGKTTVAANVGAYLADALEKPVLMIDLDFQGSLSVMAMPTVTIAGENQNSPANHLISGEMNAHSISSIGYTAINQSNLKLIPTGYDLAQAENRLLVEWLLGNRKIDIRFRLAELLHSDEVRNAFGLIIIDAPPRLTTSAIQALCATTHLLIPTILDDQSATAVKRFIGQVESLKGSLCPHMRYIGVAGTMTLNTEDGPIRSDAEFKPAERYLRTLKVPLLPRLTYIRESTQFRDAAGVGIAYNVYGRIARFAEVGSRIEALGDHIITSMGLVRRQGHEVQTIASVARINR